MDLQSSSPHHFCKKMGSNINEGGRNLMPNPADFPFVPCRFTPSTRDRDAAEKVLQPATSSSLTGVAAGRVGPGEACPWGQL